MPLGNICRAGSPCRANWHHRPKIAPLVLPALALLVSQVLQSQLTFASDPDTSLQAWQVDPGASLPDLPPPSLSHSHTRTRARASARARTH